MQGAARTLLLAGLGLALAGGGYWLGSHTQETGGTGEGASPERQILYYRNPMGLPDTSPVPKKDSMGMDYLPVYADEQAATGQERILYYRNPMGLADTSPVPKKDSMGMDYIPVYESEVSGPGLVRISAGKIQRLGVKTAPVQEREFGRSLRALGTLEVDEGSLTQVAPRFEGWIERLHVNQTGQTVRQGEPLFELYSPELYAAAQEYRIVARGMDNLARADAQSRQALARLAEQSLQRLRLWDVPAAEIARLRQGGEPRRTLSYPAPRSGVVLAKQAVEGARFMPGQVLFELADLQRLWLQVEIPETDLALARVGSTVEVTLEAYPGETFSGRVEFVYPTLNTGTRTGRVRVVLPNEAGRLKPGLYGWATLRHAAGKGLAVPESAIIDSGLSKRVLVALGEGRYQPREVSTGIREAGLWQVTAGLAAGEQVVTRANFLIDAESNLKAALSALESATPDLQPPARDAEHGQHDMSGHDMNSHDAGSHDTGGHDMNSHDAGSHDTGSHDMSAHDAGAHADGHGGH